jgi:hypothetical protein
MKPDLIPKQRLTGHLKNTPVRLQVNTEKLAQYQLLTSIDDDDLY